MAKCIRSEINLNRMDDSFKEFKAAFARLENYLEPIITYSSSTEQDDGCIVLMREFNRYCRHVS